MVAKAALQAGAHGLPIPAGMAGGPPPKRSRAKEAYYVSPAWMFFGNQELRGPAGHETRGHAGPEDGALALSRAAEPVGPKGAALLGPKPPSTPPPRHLLGVVPIARPAVPATGDPRPSRAPAKPRPSVAPATGPAAPRTPLVPPKARTRAAPATGPATPRTPPVPPAPATEPAAPRTPPVRPKRRRAPHFRRGGGNEVL